MSVPAWAARAAAGGPFSPHPDRPCVPTPQDFFSQVLVLGAMPDEREVVLLAVDRPVAGGTRIGSRRPEARAGPAGRTCGDRRVLTCGLDATSYRSDP